MEPLEYETVIGLEVHAQLKTRTKMFCGCSSDYASAPPNTHVCPVCSGMPGVLPVINRQAIACTIMTALALHCSVSEHTKFDRKNYPYPDLMKGYQISQYDAPIGVKGEIMVEVNGEQHRVGITRVHLEEDVAKLLHRAGVGETYSLVDINRAGTPLMEIVGDPDLRSPEEARQYLIKLRNILLYLDVSNANMEEGSFRCDANISIRPAGSSEYGPKVEVKNMNSFRAVFRAMEYEARRQRKAIADGERIVQETRGWVEEKGQTVSQRTKEYAHDYRYFPEPDLPPLLIDRKSVEEIKARLPELPEARRERFVAQYGLPLYDANLLTGSKTMADYFEDLVTARAVPAKDVSNWLLGPASAVMNQRNVDMVEFRRRITIAYSAQLLAMGSNVVAADRPSGSRQGALITAATSRIVLEQMFDTGKSADVIVRENGLNQISDSQAIDQAVGRAIESNPQAVADFHAGKEHAIKFLVGQVMRATHGQANPQMVNDLLKKKLTGE
jgi:aspartyl-tRNA(Asn)/glutamyl-tRNA(Gln) amidotransferase subunit B